MALLSLTDAHFDFGREKILRGVSLALHPGMKCALVGANGSGKTTLLAVLAGEIDLQKGTRQAMGRVNIQLLRQETSLETEAGDLRPLLEVVGEAAFGRERDLERELAELAGRLEGEPPSDLESIIERQGFLQAEYERLDEEYTDRLLDLRLEMEAHLLIHFRFHPGFPKQNPEPAGQLANHASSVVHIQDTLDVGH